MHEVVRRVQGRAIIRQRTTRASRYTVSEDDLEENIKAKYSTELVAVLEHKTRCRNKGIDGGAVLLPLG